jgi:DNA-binding transcriptional ArsR family regulator
MVNYTFGALAHPLRQRIVERLAQGPATVGAVTRDFGVSKPAISRHLKVLENGGVVTRAVEGRTHRLRLNISPLAEAAVWLDRQQAAWELMFDAVEEQLRARPGGSS